MCEGVEMKLFEKEELKILYISYKEYQKLSHIN